jgi:hypothetical protein
VDSRAEKLGQEDRSRSDASFFCHDLSATLTGRSLTGKCWPMGPGLIFLSAIFLSFVFVVGCGGDAAGLFVVVLLFVTCGYAALGNLSNLWIRKGTALTCVSQRGLAPPARLSKNQDLIAAGKRIGYGCKALSPDERLVWRLP